MKKPSGWFGRVEVESADVAVVSRGGRLLLVEAARTVGLDRALGGSRRCKPVAVHHRAKVALDVALSLALRRDCLGDVAVLRGDGEVFGEVASDATVSRTVGFLSEARPAPWRESGEPGQRPARGRRRSPGTPRPAPAAGR